MKPRRFLHLSSMNPQVFHYPEPFSLESGQSLPGFTLTYHTFGQLSDQQDNVIWICHALTANSNPSDWWEGLVGKGKLFDPEQYFMVCANMLGSCYGSTYALSRNPETGAPWFHDFPIITNRDISGAFDLLRDHLGIDRILMGIGGSLGGQQLLEWAVMAPDRFQKIVPLATNARHSPWGIAFNESQRMAIQADQTWTRKDPTAGLDGLRAARSVALLSYRGYDAYQLTQLDNSSEMLEGYRATTYQQYQGQKLVNRFDAFAYWTLSKAMDSQNLGRGRSSLEDALAGISAETLVIAVDTDILFPPSEQQFIADHVPGAQLHVIPSNFGHDGFLIESEAIHKILEPFLND